MNAMDGVFTTLLVIALVLTAGVLFLGIGGFALGGQFNKKYGNKLMRLRVIVQGIAVILFAIVIFMSER